MKIDKQIANTPAKKHIKYKKPCLYSPLLPLSIIPIIEIAVDSVNIISIMIYFISI